MKMQCVGQTQNCPSACYVLRFLYVIMVMLEWVSVMGGLDAGSEGGATRNIILQQRKCKFGKRCKYPYYSFWHEIPTRGHHSRGSVRSPNADCSETYAAIESGHGVPCANYFQPLTSIFDGKGGGGPQRAVRRSGQRRTPHRPIHTYPPGANSCNPVLHSERTHTHTHTDTRTHTHTHTR